MSESFMPLVFDLDSGAVTAVETSPVDPKVRMDSTGFFATDINGNKISSINPDGTGQFSGAVHATEFDMSASGGAPGTPNKVQWISTPSGLIAADISGNRFSNRKANSIHEAKAENGTGISQLIIEANSDAPSKLQISVSDDTNGNFVADILRSTGASSFLQLKSLQAQVLQLAFGSGSLQFNSSDTSNQRAFAHGLNRIPQLVWYQVKDPVNARIVVASSQAPDINSIYATGYQTQGVAVLLTQFVYWFALG